MAAAGDMDIVSDSDVETYIDDEMSGVSSPELPCMTIVSHGKYAITKKNGNNCYSSFKVPDNIELVQYTLEDNYLTFFEGDYIIKNYGCSTGNPGKFFIVDKNNGSIFQSRTKINITKPGEYVTDLNLNFTNQTITEYTKIGIKNTVGVWNTIGGSGSRLLTLTDPNIAPLTVRKNIQLSTLLLFISDHFKLKTDKTVRIIQISCVNEKTPVVFREHTTEEDEDIEMGGAGSELEYKEYCKEEGHREAYITAYNRALTGSKIPYYSIEQLMYMVYRGGNITTDDFIKFIDENYLILPDEKQALNASYSILNKIYTKKYSIGGSKRKSAKNSRRKKKNTRKHNKKTLKKGSKTTIKKRSRRSNSKK